MPQSRGFKEKAEHLVDKLIDVYQESKNKSSPPPKPSFSGSGVTHSSNSVNQLSASLNGLSISNPTTPAAGQANPGFIGGFNPAGASSAPALNSSSRPPIMPVPQIPSRGKQSVTMQMALNPNYLTRPEYNEFVNIPLPQFTPQKPPLRRSSASTPTSKVTTGLSPPASATHLVNANTLTPPRSSLSSISSTSLPSTPSRKSGSVQCAGTTKAGKQCTRQVKVDLASEDGEDDDDEKILRFCYQHTDEILEPTGFYSRKDSRIWISFDVWIPAYLQKSTQASLRAEMERKKSPKDKDGYIYTFEIKEPDGSKTIKLKVGRAVKLAKRIDQWAKQCGSKEQVLRGFYPGNGEDETSLMKGRVQAGEAARFCHRIERLVHIELADLASTCVYLEPGWPRIGTPPPAPKSKTNGIGNGCNKPCPDCGTMHKEIFEFKRWEKGEYEGKEWEEIVKRVVERWGRFVDIYL